MPRRRRTGRRLGCLGVVVVLAAAGGSAAYASRQGWIEPLPVEPRCVVSGSTGSVSLTPEQARLTAIIVGRAAALGLPPRAATIAMVTAYQESGIRNLDHGDRDSLGVFQQRPSAGWGTPDQIRDPWYASDAFYAHLVQVPGWQTGDVNDVAQAVQRSAFPHAYRKHESDARVLAEVFSGYGDGGVSCTRWPAVAAAASRGGAAGLLADLRRTHPGVAGEVVGDAITLRPRDSREGWRLGAYAVVNGPSHGLGEVRVGARRWASSAWWPQAWSGGSADAGPVVVGRA